MQIRAPGESRVQNLINSMEEGFGQLLLRAVLCAVVVVLLGAAYTYTQFRGLREVQAMHYAQLADNLALGQGYTTRVVNPSELGYHAGVESAQLLGRPDLATPPAYPAVLAGALKVLRPDHGTAPGAGYFGPEIAAIVPLGFFFALITGWFVYLLARDLFDERVALLATTAFFLSHVVLADSISGLPLTMEMCCVTASVFWAHRAARRFSAGEVGFWSWCSVALSALSCGIGILTNYAMVALVPALVVLLFQCIDLERFRVTGAWLAVVVLIVLPWGLRNHQVCGEWLGSAPQQLVSDTRLYPGDTLARTLEPSLDPVLAAKAVESRVWQRVAALYDGELWSLGGGIFFALLIASYLYRFLRHDVHTLHWAFVLAVLGFLTVAAIGDVHEGRLLHALLPIGVVFAVGFLYVLLEVFAVDDPFSRAVMIGCAVALHALPLALALMTSRPGIPYPPYYPPLIQQVAAYMDADEVLCTDIPEAVAWYGRRTALRLPLSMDAFYRIHDERQAIAGLYLTQATGGRPYVGDLVDGTSADWLPVLNRQVPTDFPLPYGISLPRGSVEQLFLSDRRRWRKP